MVCKFKKQNSQPDQNTGCDFPSKLPKNFYQVQLWMMLTKQGRMK